MWTYLLLCCLAAATVFSSDSSSASNSTISNSSIAATSDHLATGLKSYTDNFPKPACIVSVTNGSYSPFSGGSYPLQGFETVMLQALCPCCQYDRNQVLILVSNSPVLESAKDLLITLDAEHVFKICSPRYRRRESDNYFTLRHNNKMIDLKRKQSVTVRDSNKKILADLKISGSGQRVEYIEAQFPQHNITVGWAPEEVILVHLDPFISQRKALRGYCVGPDA